MATPSQCFVNIITGIIIAIIIIRPHRFITAHTSIAAGVGRAFSRVRLFDRTRKRKRIELYTPNLVHMYSIAVTFPSGWGTFKGICWLVSAQRMCLLSGRGGQINLPPQGVTRVRDVAFCQISFDAGYIQKTV